MRLLIDLYENQGDGFVALKDIAARQDISQKYLESIMTLLSKNNIVDGVHGKGGGYRLNREPNKYSVGEILRIAEGSLAPVACLAGNAKTCERADKCKTLPMWEKLDKIIEDYLDSVSLADLI